MRLPRSEQTIRRYPFLLLDTQGRVFRGGVTNPALICNGGILGSVAYLGNARLGVMGVIRILQEMRPTTFLL